MAGFIDNLIGQTSIPALEQLLKFAAARHQVLVGNIANIDTPGYQVQELSVADFQKSLAKAIENKRSAGGRLVLRGRQVRTGADGRLHVRPGPATDRNVTFHDGGNRQVEREMAALAENTLAYNMAAEMLRSQFEGLKKAIRQKV